MGNQVVWGSVIGAAAGTGAALLITRGASEPGTENEEAARAIIYRALAYIAFIGVSGPANSTTVHLLGRKDGVSGRFEHIMLHGSVGMLGGMLFSVMLTNSGNSDGHNIALVIGATTAGTTIGTVSGYNASRHYTSTASTLVAKPDWVRAVDRVPTFRLINVTF